MPSNNDLADFSSSFLTKCLSISILTIHSDDDCIACTFVRCSESRLFTNLAAYVKRNIKMFSQLIRTKSEGLAKKAGYWKGLAMRPILFDFFVYLVRHRFLTQAILAVFAIWIYSSSKIYSLLSTIGESQIRQSLIRRVTDSSYRWYGESDTPRIVDVGSCRLRISMLQRIAEELIFWYYCISEQQSPKLLHKSKK